MPADITAVASAPAQADVLDKLPPPAREKLEKLRDDLARARDIQRGASQRADEAHQEWTKARDFLNRLEIEYRAGRMTRTTTVRADHHAVPFVKRGGPDERVEVREVTRIEPDDVRLESERARVARLGREHDRRRAEVNRMGETAAALGTLTRRIEDYIRALPRGVGIEIDDGGDDPIEGDPLAAVEHCRHQLRAIVEEIADVEHAAVHSAEIRRALHEQIDGLAATGRPNLTGLSGKRARPTLNIPTAPLNAGVVLTKGDTGFAHGQIQDAVALIAWLFGPQLKKAADALIREEADDDVALTDEERATRLADLQARRLTVERAEEAAIETAEQHGAIVLRRADADVRAVLGINGPSPKE